MKWEDVLELEKRNNNNLYQINLILEGEFWHAYEWSAYLCNHFPSDKLGKDGHLKPNRKSFGDRDIINVGLKFTSFDKYFPGIKDNEKRCAISDNQITIDAKGLIDIENRPYVDILYDWKQNFDIKSSKRNKAQNSTNNNTRDYVFDRIMKLELEKTTPFDALCFLSEIKHILSVGGIS